MLILECSIRMYGVMYGVGVDKKRVVYGVQPKRKILGIFVWAADVSKKKKKRERKKSHTKKKKCPMGLIKEIYIRRTK